MRARGMTGPGFRSTSPSIVTSLTHVDAWFSEGEFGMSSLVRSRTQHASSVSGGQTPRAIPHSTRSLLHEHGRGPKHSGHCAGVGGHGKGSPIDSGFTHDASLVGSPGQCSMGTLHRADSHHRRWWYRCSYTGESSPQNEQNHFPHLVGLIKISRTMRCDPGHDGFHGKDGHPAIKCACSGTRIS